MTTWKDIACERLVIPLHAKDSHVLDEMIRYEIEGGNRLLQIRDQLSKLLHFMQSDESTCPSRRAKLHRADCSRAMRGLTHVVQVLRTKVAERYRAEAEGSTGIVREDFQQPATYTDPKTQRT